jgi:8-oxo-dGTP diphosphatase
MSTRIVDVAIGILVRDNRVLVCRRKQSGTFAGYWEFPGGKCEPNEPPAACVLRELSEEVGVTAEVLRLLAPIEHDYGHVHVRLFPFACALTHGEPAPLAADELLWADAEQLTQLKFPEANDELLEEVREMLSRAMSG